MRILVHDYGGYAFPVQLSRSLAARGHAVSHVYFESLIGPRGPLSRRPGDPEKFDIRGICLPEVLDKHSLLKRRRQEIEYGRRLVREVDRFGPDLVISANTPLDAQAILMARCRTGKVGFVYWAQDLLGVASRKLLGRRLPVAGAAVGWHYMRMERALLRRSDAVVLITDDWRPLVEHWGVDPQRAHVIPNWAPVEEIDVLPKSNAWSRAHGLEDKLCFLYAGTLGMKHNPELLLQLAMRFRDLEDVRVVVASEGRGMWWLEEKKRSLDLSNLMLLGFQPFESLPAMLATGDVLVAVLEREAGVFSVPSKVLSCLCAGRPLLLAVPPDNLAARIVTESRAGLVVDPEDTESFLMAAETLAGNEVRRAEMGRNGRRYAEEHFDIEAIADRFEAVLRLG